MFWNQLILQISQSSLSHWKIAQFLLPNCLSFICYNEYHRLVAYEQGNLFLTVLELKIQDQSASTVRFWWKPSSGLWTADFSLCPCVAEASFLKAPIPSMGAPSSWPEHLSKSPSPNTITLGGRISTCELGWRGAHTLRLNTNSISWLLQRQ